MILRCFEQHLSAADVQLLFFLPFEQGRTNTLRLGPSGCSSLLSPPSCCLQLFQESACALKFGSIPMDTYTRQLLSFRAAVPCPVCLRRIDPKSTHYLGKSCKPSSNQISQHVSTKCALSKPCGAQPCQELPHSRQATAPNF